MLEKIFKNLFEVSQISDEERKQYIKFITQDLKASNYNQNFIGVIKETFDLYQEEKGKKEYYKDSLENIRKGAKKYYIHKDKIKQKYQELFEQWKDCSNNDYEQLNIINAKMEVLSEFIMEE